MNEDQEPMLAGMESVVVEVPPTEDEEAARKRAREFNDALYAALVSRAESDQAKALVDPVTALVAQRELAANARTHKRGKTRAAVLRAALERFLADLLQAHSVERARGYVYRPMRPEGFTGGAASYRTFKSVVPEKPGSVQRELSETSKKESPEMRGL
jgi:hypothetical protein